MIFRQKQPFLWIGTLMMLAIPTTATARPDAPRVLCMTYPDTYLCSGGLATCATCHTSTWPVGWNDFGLQVASAMQSGDYAESLSDALTAIADEDADGDGVSNFDEISVGTAPGDARDVGILCPANPSEPNIGEDYDFARAYRRVHVLFCGQSPKFEDLQGLENDEAQTEARYHTVHDALQACLDSPYWQNEGLHRLADDLIRPTSDNGLPFADFWWDYRLFSYIMTRDRDVRDLLLADYHVEAQDDGTLTRVEGVVPGTTEGPLFAGSGGQPLEPQYRAGMITTQWFLVLNSARTDLPRNSAARAYRGYLGFDLATNQGIIPIADEPKDIDRKGVSDARCAACHSTLDPLTYGFAFYNGMTQDNDGNRSGSYDPDRPKNRILDWQDNQTMLFGEPVDGVVGWAQRAVSSDAFKRNLADMLFHYTFNRGPEIREQGAFEDAWRALPEDGWSANRLIHRFIDLPAFGA